MDNHQLQTCHPEINQCASQAPREVHEEVVGESAFNLHSQKHNEILFPKCKRIECPNVSNGYSSEKNQQNFIKFVNSVIQYKVNSQNKVENQLEKKQFQSLIPEKLYNQQFRSSYKQPNPEIGSRNSDANKPTCQSRYSMKDDNDKVIHPGIECDGCHQFPIRGPRFKCQQCMDYDLCEGCFHSKKHHHANFHMIAIPRRDVQKQMLRSSIQNQANSSGLSLGGIFETVTSFFR